MEKILLVEKPNEHHPLAPCPFCGSDDVVFFQYEHIAGNRWKVFCCGCTAQIDPGYAQDKYTVQQMWNRRK